MLLYFTLPYRCWRVVSGRLSGTNNTKSRTAKLNDLSTVKSHSPSLHSKTQTSMLQAESKCDFSHLIYVKR
jgi:hypothetical protein